MVREMNNHAGYHQDTFVVNFSSGFLNKCRSHVHTSSDSRKGTEACHDFHDSHAIVAWPADLLLGAQHDQHDAIAVRSPVLGPPRQPK